MDSSSLDGYQCEICNAVFPAYQRECPFCFQEKTIRYSPNLALKRFLLNLITTTPKEKLDELWKLSRLDKSKLEVVAIINSVQHLEES